MGPEKAAYEDKMSNTYKRRKSVRFSFKYFHCRIIDLGTQLREARVQYLKGQGYGRRVVQLFDSNSANSEDEEDKATNSYIVKTNEARSPAVTRFAILIDQFRNQQTGTKRTRKVMCVRLSFCTVVHSFFSNCFISQNRAHACEARPSHCR